jgi:hypothetical protein
VGTLTECGLKYGGIRNIAPGQWKKKNHRRSSQDERKRKIRIPVSIRFQHHLQKLRQKGRIG